MHDPSPNPVPYTLTRDGERWVFRPDATFVVLMVVAFAAGSAFCVCQAVSFFRGAGDAAGVGFGFIFLLAAGLLAGPAVWAWRTRHTPLTIERGGRVCYGERELCATGAVRAVRIAPARGGECGDCEVCLESDGGKLVSLPSLYFAGFRTREHARPFAEQLARALGVGVVESV
jgi:hypothetical protein